MSAAAGDQQGHRPVGRARRAAPVAAQHDGDRRRRERSRDAAHRRGRRGGGEGQRGAEARGRSRARGAGPADVAAFVRRAVNQKDVLPARPSRRTITLGATAGGTPIEHAVGGRNVLIAGHPQSGKSWIAGLMAEQMLLMRQRVRDRSRGRLPDARGAARGDDRGRAHAYPVHRRRAARTEAPGHERGGGPVAGAGLAEVRERAHTAAGGGRPAAPHRSAARDLRGRGAPLCGGSRDAAAARLRPGRVHAGDVPRRSSRRR